MTSQLEQRPRVASADDLPAFLDAIAAELLDGPSIGEAVDHLRLGLFECRQASGPDWGACCELISQHPLAQLVHQDPITGCSSRNTRGYPGDPGLIDLVCYDQGFDYGEPTAMGEAILRASRDAPVSRAIRERRNHMATLIDQVALSVPDASVLALGAGHLREGLRSSAVMAGALSSLVALDHDRASLGIVEQALGPRVTCVQASIRRLLTHDVAGVTSERFDLVYSAGLLDCLGDRVAARLLHLCWGLLKPGGELVMANLATDIMDSGYMESLMELRPMYRNRTTLLELAAGITSSSVGARCYTLSSGEITYLQLSNGVK